MSSTQQRKVVEIKAADLAEALWGHYSWYKGLSDLSKGYYQGTRIPLRSVPADALLVVEIWSNGGLVSDTDGGWIADRFGPTLSTRETRRVLKTVQGSQS